MKLSAKDTFKPVGKKPNRNDEWHDDAGFLDKDDYEAYCDAIQKVIYERFEQGERPLHSKVEKIVRATVEYDHRRFADGIDSLKARATITEIPCGCLTRYEPRTPPDHTEQPYTAFSIAPPSDRTQPDSDSFRSKHRVTA